MLLLSLLHCAEAAVFFQQRISCATGQLLFLSPEVCEQGKNWLGAKERGEGRNCLCSFLLSWCSDKLWGSQGWGDGHHSIIHTGLAVSASHVAEAKDTGSDVKRGSWGMGCMTNQAGVHLRAGDGVRGGLEHFFFSHPSSICHKEIRSMRNVPPWFLFLLMTRFFVPQFPVALK